MISAGEAGGIAVRAGLPPGLAVFGPGMREHDIPQALIFDAGKACGAADAITHFYAEEMLELDWLRDYVMNDDLAALGHDLEDIFRVEEDSEDYYSKVDTTQIQSDGSWADS